MYDRHAFQARVCGLPVERERSGISNADDRHAFQARVCGLPVERERSGISKSRR